MTERELLKNALIEINKLEAPALLLDDYLYFINKAVQQYTNDVYNRYEVGQQSTDDLRALKRTAVLEVLEDTTEESQTILPDESSEYYCILPINYLHLLNCVVNFEKVGDTPEKKKRCNGIPDKVKKSLNSPAHKLTADIYPTILTNYYFKPSYKMPYYFINRTEGIDEQDPYYRLVHIIDPTKTGTPEDYSADHQKMEIRCGDTSTYVPKKVFIDYIKTPEIISLTEADIDSIKDNTKELEFPEYVCYEIINIFTRLLLENASDPRLQSHIPINNTIGSPAPSKK